MSLTDQLPDYVNAAFSGLWVLTQEPDEAEREVAQLARQRGWKLAAWDVAAGLRVPSEQGAFRGDAMPGDPLAVLRAVPTLADPGGTALATSTTGCRTEAGWCPVRGQHHGGPAGDPVRTSEEAGAAASRGGS